VAERVCCDRCNAITTPGEAKTLRAYDYKNSREAKEGWDLCKPCHAFFKAAFMKNSDHFVDEFQ
jgi:hypothetical protein